MRLRSRYDGEILRLALPALGAQALWLSLGVGVALAALIAALAGPVVALVGGRGQTGGWGVRGVWAALALLIAVRLSLLGARFVRRRWLVTGWAPAR